MMPPGPEYPPQFSDSSISGVLGDINDFSGTDDGGGDFKALSAKKAVADPVPSPVFVTGIAGPKQPVHPGLRETMTASAILRLISTLPQNDPNVKAINKAAFRLMGVGAAKLVVFSRKNS